MGSDATTSRDKKILAIKNEKFTRLDETDKIQIVRLRAFNQSKVQYLADG